MISHNFTLSALSKQGFEAKQNTRLFPLQALQEHSTGILYNHTTNTLKYDWLELSGVQAPTFQMLLDNNALSETGTAKFIGLDIDPDVISGCIEHYSQPHLRHLQEWHTGNLEALLERKNAFPNVGVLVYDTEDGIWRGKWDNLQRVTQYALRQYEKLGEFLLVINVVADPRFATSMSIQRYCDKLSELTGARVKPDSLHRYTSKKSPMLWTMITFGF